MTLLEERLNYHPPLPNSLQDLSSLHAAEGECRATPHPFLEKTFPHTQSLPRIAFSKGAKTDAQPLRVGVVLSGGQASGGHNVITGLYDALQALHPKSELLGFLDGPSGLIDGTFRKLDTTSLAPYRNTGGFDLIGSGRTKIQTPEQFAKVRDVVAKEKLDGLVIIGGDDSNTNAAFLAEYFLAEGLPTRVVGIPKTIDGDLKNDTIESSFGFDTAAKTYAETISSILRDSISAKKYYFFIRLMGRSASHIALECALQTHPHVTLIGEEVAQKGQTLQQLTQKLADVIENRAKQGKNYGVVLIPEGIIEFVPECRTLINELNHLLAEAGEGAVEAELSAEARACFDQMPEEIQRQLLLDRDPHGNVQVAKIESERLFISMVERELAKRKQQGSYPGKFSSQPLYLGYEGRSCFPSNFDVHYGNALGYVAALLIHSGKTGCMASVGNLTAPVEEWTIAGTPIVEMLVLETREGKQKPVIEKALVNLDGAPFQAFAKQRKEWEQKDDFQFLGPIQFFGPKKITDDITETLKLER